MEYLIDTDVAIHLRDGAAAVAALIIQLDAMPSMSIITLTELQVGAAQSNNGLRAALLTRLRQSVPVLPFGEPEAEAYGRIIAAMGYDRRCVLDRMIAAQAITSGRRLITMNGRDFAKIPGLDLEVWTAP
ncbi:MAG: hypothetical protein RLY97_2244 [Pseudomonadota bacterium]|jgi:tRNA(fMet)-specific endonuclease VapC